VSARVLITGASSGIGEATARELRAQGARVVGLDLRAASDDVIECDVRDQEAVDRGVAAAIERLGGLDALINNAGVGFAQSAGAPPDERALAVIDVNMLGPWRVTGAALPALRESRGRVVNVASGLVHLTLPFATAYCMSKRGLVAYSDALRLEHGDAIAVTTVYPGYVRTPIHAASQEEGFALEGLVPVEDVGEVARTLARAALGPPVRDLATTRRGGLGYALLRRAPRRLVDRGTAAVLRRYARAGRFDDSRMAAEFVSRLGARPARTS
jgi:NAD(P)-dependent dehydrogenase (short-subunit alcohol dehydrogenase family)